MSLAVALHNARTSLLTTARQIAVSGSNISNADNPDYSRKTAEQMTAEGGAATIRTIQRAADPNLLQRVLTANAGASGQKAVMDGLNQLHTVIGDTDSGVSPAARLAALATALQAQANAPAEPSLARASMTAAEGVVTALHEATATVTRVRTEADQAMAESVDNIRDLLQKIETLNQAVVTGTFTGDDVTNALDQRDAAINALSQEIGVRTVYRDGGDIALYTESGVPLFDKTARTITFQVSSAMAPGIAGSGVTIDGVPVIGPGATMKLQHGNLAGLAELRDQIAPTFQNQLDEMARGAIEALAESDQSGGGGPDLAGLLTWSGGPALPPSGAVATGIAGTIRINPAADPAQGGAIERIRDGGINGAAYLYNGSSAVSFSDRLQGLVTGLGAARSFDGAAALSTSSSALDFGTESIAWLQELRQTTSNSADYQTTLATRMREALSNAAGVNIDDEYAKQLQLEQSFQASSKLLNVIDQMFDALFAAVR